VGVEGFEPPTLPTVVGMRWNRPELMVGRMTIVLNEPLNFDPALPSLHLSLPRVSFLFGGVGLRIDDHPVFGLPREAVVAGQVPP